MSYRFEPGRIYRMPTHFGPSVSPRQPPTAKEYDWSASECLSVSVTLPVDRDGLEGLLPPGFALLGAPELCLTFSYLTNLPWLAGRGYNTLGVTVPVRYCDAHVGSLMLVLWENMADPILTGREELGMPKIFCDLPAARRTGATIDCTAEWHGFRFLNLTVSGLHESLDTALPDPATLPTRGQLLHYRHLPAVGDWGAVSVAEVTLTPPARGDAVLAVETGMARIDWHVPRWEDMPTQSEIVNRLASICVADNGCGEILVTRGGAYEHRDQQVVARL